MAKESQTVYWLKNAAYALGLPAYALLMRSLSSGARTDRERLALARRVRFRGYSLRPYQVDDEIVALLAELRSRNPRRVVEIGTARGGTLFLLLRALAREAHVVSVDLHRGEFGGGYPHWKIPLFHAMAVGGPRLTLLRGNSQSLAMRQKVQESLGGPADFILIDGDHSYEGAKRDFELYREIVAPGGLLAFHDIVPGGAHRVGGVPRLWQELKSQYAHREFVKSWDQHGFGIGLLCL